MRTFIYFIFTCFISTGAFLGALNANYPFPLYVVGFGIWALFIWGQARRNKRKMEKRRMEEEFRAFMRSKLNH